MLFKIKVFADSKKEKIVKTAEDELAERGVIKFLKSRR